METPNSSTQTELTRPGSRQHRLDGTRVLLFHGITGSPAELSPLRDHLHSLGCTVDTPLLEGHETSIEEMRYIPLERWLSAATSAYLALAGAPPRPGATTTATFVGGLSFGAFLALHCATSPACPPPAGCIMLSPPFRLKKPTDEILLGWLSCLPDSILNTLPLVEKNVRDTSRFIAPRKSYDQHSVGTIARILRLRRALRIRSAQLSCPVLTIIDPLDHHLSKSATDIALTLFPKSVLPMHRFLPGGEHELSIGPRGVAVQKIVEEFMFRALDARISKDPTDAS